MRVAPGLGGTAGSPPLRLDRNCTRIADRGGDRLSPSQDGTAAGLGGGQVTLTLRELPMRRGAERAGRSGARAESRSSCCRGAPREGQIQVDASGRPLQGLLGPGAARCDKDRIRRCFCVALAIVRALDA